MITVIQRVKHANVIVEDEELGRIEQGIMALIAVEKQDTERQADQLLQRILNYRIFADEHGKMNLSLRDINGGLLAVPQFTLAADTRSGNRPSFSTAAPPEVGRQLFDYFQQRSVEHYPHAQFGRFGADMQVALVNDGPVTFTLQVK